MKLQYGTELGTERQWYQLFIRESKTCGFCYPRTTSQRVSIWCPVALMTVFAGSALNWSEKCNHAIVEPLRDNTNRIHIWKSQDHYRPPAQAARDGAPKRAHLKSQPSLLRQRAESSIASTPHATWVLADLVLLQWIRSQFQNGLGRLRKDLITKGRNLSEQPEKLQQHAHNYQFSEVAVRRSFVGAKVQNSPLEMIPLTSNSDPDKSTAGFKTPVWITSSPEGLYSITKRHSSRRY